MLLSWINSRAVATWKEVFEFEVLKNLKLPNEYAQFLVEQSDGGKPSVAVAIPTEDCFGGAGGLAAIYGLNHPNDNLDLGEAIGRLRKFLPELFPIGYDEGGGELFVNTSNQSGELLYIPWDELDDVPVHPYHVANSIAEFFEVGPALAIKLVADEEEY